MFDCSSVLQWKKQCQHDNHKTHVQYCPYPQIIYIMFHDYLTTCCDTKLNIVAFHLEGNGEERNRQCKWEQHAKKMFLLNMTQFSSFVTNCTILLDRFLIGQLGLSLGGLLKLSDDRDHQISICYFLSGLVRQLKRSDEFVLKTHSRTHTHTVWSIFHLSSLIILRLFIEHNLWFTADFSLSFQSLSFHCFKSFSIFSSARLSISVMWVG